MACEDFIGKDCDAPGEMNGTSGRFLDFSRPLKILRSLRKALLLT